MKRNVKIKLEDRKHRMNKKTKAYNMKNSLHWNQII